ncbi:hypothetical protein AB0915_26300, partial [Streptomyces sp. NPDC048411]
AVLYFLNSPLCDLFINVGLWVGARWGVAPSSTSSPSDEKTSVQARCPCHPTLPPGRTRAMRINHEYGRGGALAYLAAYDAHRVKAFDRCAPKTRIVRS